MLIKDKNRKIWEDIVIFDDKLSETTLNTLIERSFNGDSKIWPSSIVQQLLIHIAHQNQHIKKLEFEEVEEINIIGRPFA